MPLRGIAQARTKVWELLALAAVGAIALAGARSFMLDFFERERESRARVVVPAYTDVFAANAEHADESVNWISDPVHLEALHEAVTFAMSICSAGFLVLKLARARPRIRHAGRLAGASASLACVCVLGVYALRRAMWLASKFALGISIGNTRWTDFVVVRGEGIAGSVIAVWIMLLLVRRLRTEWDLLEILSVALGVLWILEPFARSVFAVAVAH